MKLLEQMPLSEKRETIRRLLSLFLSQSSGSCFSLLWEELPVLDPSLTELSPEECRALVRFCGSSGLLWRYREEEDGFSAEGVAQLAAYQIDPEQANRRHYGSIAIRTICLMAVLLVACVAVRLLV